MRDLLEGVPRERNIYVPAKILFRESTKDCTDREDKRSDEIYQKLIETREKHNQQSYFSMDMDGCTDYAEMKQIVAKNLYLLGTCKEFYLGLLGEEKDHIRYFKQDITSYAKLGMAIRDDQMLNVSGERFRQKDLLPEEVCDDSWKVYYLRVLHNREKNFGYAIVQFENPLDGPDEFYHENEEKSVTDYLTGLNNRRGMEDYINKKWPEWILGNRYLICASVDVDGLKVINDSYGHKEGDWAICAVAEACA